MSSLYLCIPLPTSSRTLLLPQRLFRGLHFLSQTTRITLRSIFWLQSYRDVYIVKRARAISLYFIYNEPPAHSFLYHSQKSSEICAKSVPHHLNKFLIILCKQDDIIKAFPLTDSPPSSSQWCFFSVWSGIHRRTF